LVNLIKYALGDMTLHNLNPRNDTQYNTLCNDKTPQLYNEQVLITSAAKTHDGRAMMA